ncbi:hypothetical protein [Pseudomonas sp. UV AK001]|uniref:hypothetical protein n=1 Tax=Pseudomonas sp. UV AK001 TaxID=3384791 RepID=UPI0038D3C879
MTAPASNYSRYKMLSFLLFLAAFYLSFYFSLNFNPFSDDQTFLEAATSGTPLLQYLSERYYTWTGRIAIESIMFLTIATPSLWKLAIPTFLLLAAYSTWKSFLSDKIDYNHGIPLCLFFLLLINPAILGTTVFYVTGFYNYLLPISCGLFATAIFIRPKNFSTVEKFIAIPLAFIASQSEQVGISMIGAFTAFLIWDHKNLITFRVTLYLVVSAGFTLLITAPGNYLRLASEVLYMPEFKDYSFLRKVLTGFDVFNAHYVDPGNLYPKAIALLLVLLSIGKNFAFKRTALILLMCGAFQGGIFSYIFLTGDNEYYSIRYLSSGFGLAYFSSYTLSITSLISMIYIMRKTLNASSAFYLGALLVLLHTGATTIVGLSPTAYESGSRVLLTGDIISLVLICLLLKNTIECYSNRISKLPKIC